MCEVYPHASWLQAKRFNFNRFMDKVLAVSGLVALFIGMFYGSFKAGQATTQASTTHANILVPTEVIKEVRKSAPVMERIAKCESGAKHIEASTGQVVMRSNTNKTVDIGKYQINTVWFKKATELGYDITTEKGNEAMAYWIYENRGTQDWYASASCWN